MAGDVAHSPALTPTRVRADGRRTWAGYQPATRAAMIDLAGRHRLDLLWRDDVPYELACTFPVQPGLSFAVMLGLVQGTLHCWGDGWTLDGLEALIAGSGRLVLRTAHGDFAPFWTAQVRRGR